MSKMSVLVLVNSLNPPDAVNGAAVRTLKKRKKKLKNELGGGKDETSRVGVARTLQRKQSIEAKALAFDEPYDVKPPNCGSRRWPLKRA